MSVESPPRTPAPGSAPEARVYRLLGTLYLQPPDRELLETVGLWAERWLDRDPPERVAKALEPLAAVAPSDADRLNEAFTTLFRGVVPGTPRPPYESAYRDGELTPGGRSLRQEYREAGVDVAPDSGELADHLGIELHFVATLLAEGRVNRAEQFLADHPRQFFDEVARAVGQRDPPPFYEGLLSVTEFAIADVSNGGR